MNIIGTYLRTVTASPKVSIADPKANFLHIKSLYLKNRDADIVIFPELAVTGYTAGDLFFQEHLLRQSEKALAKLAALTKEGPAMIVGAPLSFKNKLFNCALVLAEGEIMGAIPKIHLPNYNEFYEKRWFESGANITEAKIEINQHIVPFGTDILFELAGITLGIEICEDLWAVNPPSTNLALAGAEVIINPSASNELIGKHTYRRDLVVGQSARLLSGYVYAASSPDESTADTVFSGHMIIAQSGRLLAEKRWKTNSSLAMDIDIDQIRHDRKQNTAFSPVINYSVIKLQSALIQKRGSLQKNSRHPFIPGDKAIRDQVVEEILTIQAHGIAKQMSAAGIETISLGLSGGLDSTLALIAAIRAMELLKLPASNIYTVTLPASASSKNTQDNATKLANAVGTTHEIIPIQKQVDAQLKSIGHDTKTQDITYENAQARIRTNIIMNKANTHRALILGTGDLSEIALGWATFNGDHMSTYHVNASVPKTLVRYIIDWAKDQDDFSGAKTILKDILSTPISPELTDDEGMQETEELIGPYELHDFFLYHFKRWGSSKDKIQLLAEASFKDYYSEDEINKWLNEFYRRFTANQFKRESSPNGPKIGSVSLSPRSDWRMSPSVSASWYK